MNPICLPSLCILGSLSLAGSLSLLAGPKLTPLLPPDEKYHVHDVKRPRPQKVVSQGVVVQAPPADAVVLFDGKSTDAWDKAWEVKDGVMIATGGKEAGDIRSKESFGDMQLHIEWRVPAGREVSGQKGANSGVFLMDNFEIQIQESHSNVTYADGQAAAMYGQYPPLVNASTAQGEWQSYDIIFQAPVYDESGLKSPALVTVIHNGVVVQAQRAFLGPTKFRKLGKYPASMPAKAPIRLQWHSDPVEFRNIWARHLVEKVESPTKASK